MNNNNLFSKYQDLFKIAENISRLYYTKHISYFKSISFDIEDLIQEVYLRIMPSIKKYHHKYRKEKKLFPEKFIIETTKNIIKNIIRDSFHKQLCPLEIDIIKNPKKEELSFSDIKKIILKHCTSTRQFNIFYQHIFENKTFSEIAEEYNISKVRAYQIYKKITIKLLKEKELIFKD